MKLVIHDLSQQDTDKIEAFKASDVTVVDNNGKIHPCIGCFECWIKTPGKCIILNDSYGNMGELLSTCDELCIITECRYGSFSPFVKNVLDRSIGYLHPYFKIIDGEMHHKKRYNKTLKTKVFYYGNNLTDGEKKTFEEIVGRVAINFYMQVQSVAFLESKDELKGLMT